MEVVSRGHSLFRKHPILLMKSGEVKTQKQNYLAFFSDTAYPPGIFLAPSCQIPSLLSFIIFNCLSRYHIVVAIPTSLPLSTTQTFHGLMEIRPFLSISTDRIVRPLGLNQKIPPSHALGGWEKLP